MFKVQSQMEALFDAQDTALFARLERAWLVNIKSWPS